MLELNVYKNNDSTSEQYGKAYARVDYKEQYDVTKASIGNKTARVNNQTVETGNAVKNVKLLAVATGEYTREELNKDATLGWTKKAQELIDADKALMAQPSNP